MIDACAKAGDVPKAEEWFAKMSAEGFNDNLNSYSAVIDACAKAGDSERAEFWLHETINAGITEDVVTYSAVIDACAKASDVDRAQRVYNLMLKRSVKPNIVTYTSLARAFSRLGRWADVEAILELMESEGLKINEYFLNAQLCAYATCQPRQPLRAEEAFRYALSAGVKPNNFILHSLEKALGKDHYARCLKSLGLKGPARYLATHESRPPSQKRAR
eukprot:gnl/MRDRNA2_/MRDRNA2_62693_c0_seq2.p1 gnl/MRDRNA2_/MRDRNA2_62693_c0~~gnl/MRDRNA2_/MRDRNA2_62693_c0_seq2.p1  ORF type:complete len:247 (-),score=42.57 gnl/MRDRNA2_/MRDRNA2_62693_c0_seq2:8-661(-)